MAKGVFIEKRLRTDIQRTISVLSSQFHNPTVTDLETLVRLCKYLNLMVDLHLVVPIDDMKVIKLYIYASYAVNEDVCSKLGLVTTFGKGSAISSSLKQKLNMCSSTKDELVRVDDFMAMMLWTQHFINAQLYVVFKNIMFQDNNSVILFYKTGRKSVRKCIRHLNVR